MDQASAAVTGTKFFVLVMGETKGAHRDIVSKLTSTGQTEVSSPKQSDYLLVFCSIMSEDEMSISDFLENFSGSKPIILVVMHHTFNPDKVVAPSRRHVDNLNVCLTVDCLFYEGKLLQCERNDSAWVDIQKSLGVSTSKVSASDDTSSMLWSKFFVFMMGPTKGAHRDIVSKFKSSGQTEVSSPEESDYLLVFCSIMSEIEMYISEFLENISGGKPIILVVMHHTDNPDQVVAPSRRQVDNPNICLTVDCLLYEGRFLQCDCNNSAWADIQKCLGVSTSLDPTLTDYIHLTGTKFCVLVMGATKGAYRDIVSKLTSTGQTEVSSPEESDYLLVFCSIMSEDEMSISDFLENFSGGKPIILVVMHHTFNPHKLVPPSRRQVDNLNVYLTVDCLFYEGKPLQCNHNDSAWVDIQKCLGVSTSQDSTSDDFVNLSWKKFCVTAIGGTDGAHEDIVAKLKSIGQTEASSHEESDYLLIFCSIVSEIDINRVMEDHSVISGCKPIILVVIHHTSNPEQAVAPSRTQVENRNVHLTVDCLFYESSFLQCKHNDRAWADIKKLLGVSTAQVRRTFEDRKKWWNPYRK